MLSRWRSNAQPSLLERYWTALRRDRAAMPPDGLDADLADMAQRLAASINRLDPPNAVVAELRQRIVPSTTTSNNRAPAWSSPAIDPARQRRTARAIKESEEEHIMSDISTASPEPIQLPRRSWQREVLKLLAAAIVFGIVGAVLALTLRGDDSEGQPAVAPVTETPTVVSVATPTTAATEAAIVPATATATSSGQTATAAPAPSPAISLPIVESVLTTIPVGQDPRALAVGAGSIWVTNGSDGAVSRIDPATNTVIATIDVSSSGNRTADAIVADDSAVWVMAGKLTLVHIDPATNEVVATIPSDQPIDMLVLGDGTLWALSPDSNLLRRVDPATNTFTTTIEITRLQDAKIIDGTVWVLHDLGRGTDSEILKIDPATGSTLMTISLDDYSVAMLVEGDALWVPASDSALLQIDLATGQRVATYPYPAAVRGVPLITSGNGAVWVCDCTHEPNDAIWQFDISTQQWTAQIPVGDVPWRGWLVAFEGALWSYNEENAVMRIQLPD